MNQIAVSGLVATTPRHLVTVEGLPITSFHLAVESSDKSKTNWYTVISFHSLAIGSAISISKGDRVVVVGELNVRDWDNGSQGGTSVEIEASSIGHDLVWGSSVFTRTVFTSQQKTGKSEEQN